MHNKKLDMNTVGPACPIGTDSMWIEHGLVKQYLYHTPMGSFLAEPRSTFKPMRKSEKARQVRAPTRACRRLGTLSCLRRMPWRHKISMFLKTT